MAMRLVEAGAGVNHRADNGTYPILAAVNGSLECLEYLIGVGADVNISNTYGMTALHWASKNGQDQMVELLLKSGATASLEAINDQYRNTPLHFAAGNRHIDIIRTLVKAGANVNAVTSDGKNALQLLWSMERNKEIFALMIESGIDPDTRLGYDTTLLHWAAEYGDNESAERLIKAGADVNAFPGCTALYEAAEHGSAKIAKMLIDAGADVNAGETTKRTCIPIMIAAEKGHLSIVKALVQAGARLDCSNAAGETPLDVARGWKRDKVVEYLEHHISVENAEVVRGGFGEPYCSAKCLSQAGKYSSSVLLKNQSGVCGICQRPVQASMYGTPECVAIPFEDKTLFVCVYCVKEARVFLSNYRKCCVCQKALL